MADENMAIAPTEQAAPAIDQEAPTEQIVDEPERIPGPEEATEGQEGEPASEPEDDLEEFDWNGKTIRGPKGLKDGVLMQADYTKKTQAVSERQKALESREAEINQMRQFTEAELDLRSNLRAVNAELERFKQFDWNAYQQARQTDPFGADEAWNYAQHMRSQKAELEQVLGNVQAERAGKAQQDLAKRVQETNEFAQKEIPGWSPDLTDKLIKLARDIGVPDQTLQANWSPTFYKLLHRAHVGEQLLQRQTAVPKPPPVPVTPLQVVGGKAAPARVDLASADMDAYVAARKKGVGGKALR